MSTSLGSMLCHPQAQGQPGLREATPAAHWAFVFLGTPPRHAEAENNGVPYAGSTAAKIQQDPRKESRSRWICRQPFPPQQYEQALMAAGPVASKTAVPVRWVQGAVVGKGGPSRGSWHASAAGVHSPVHPSRVRNIPVGSGGRRAK